MRSMLSLVFALALMSFSHAQQSFQELVGNVQVGPVEKAKPTPVPYLTWGGDVATFLANGELRTQPGSEYQKLGLDLQLVPGDDFVDRSRTTCRARHRFLRGTVHMLGQASEVLSADPRTKPVIILQLSWSAGDHVVARENIKSLNNLKGKKFACQQGGPHVGLLYDSLTSRAVNQKRCYDRLDQRPHRSGRRG